MLNWGQLIGRAGEVDTDRLRKLPICNQGVCETLTRNAGTAGTAGTRGNQEEINTQVKSQSLIALGPEGIAHTCRPTCTVQVSYSMCYDTVTTAAKTNMKTTYSG